MSAAGEQGRFGLTETSVRAPIVGATEPNGITETEIQPTTNRPTSTSPVDAATWNATVDSTHSKTSRGAISPAPWPPAGVKPYYADDSVCILLGDCRELLPLMPKVDLVLTDPPYGVTLQNHRTANNRRRDREWAITGDESTAIGNRVLYELRRLPIIAFACPEKPWGAGVPWKQHLVWDKGGAVGGGGDPATYWKRTWELLQVANTSRLNGPRDNAVLRYFMTPQDSSEHPAAKPVELLRYLIVKATNSNDTILDPFMGSGTTLVAAQSLGRKSIGIEIEERYCQIAVERLRQKPLPLEYTTQGHLPAIRHHS